MGGKPLKPKIQAYVDRRWFDEFEVYRDSHNLNQSKALEKILAEFFGGSSSSTSPPNELDTARVPTLVDAIRSEFLELRQEVEQRLQIVESKLGVESAIPLNRLAAESADDLVVHLDDSVYESAYGLATSAYESAREPAISQVESAVDLIDLAANPVNLIADLDAGLADESAIESAPIEATTALDEPVESAVVDLHPLTSLGLAARLGVDNGSISRNRHKGNPHFRVWSAKHDPDRIAWEFREGVPRSPQFHPIV